MILKNNNRFKPFYKQQIDLKENIQNQKKVLNFKKKKWKKFIKNYLRNQIKRNKYRPKDQNQYIVSRYPTRWSSYKRRYKNTKQIFKKFKLFYGQFSNIFFKKKIKELAFKKYKKRNLSFLAIFEQRLDTVLYRSKFCNSIQKSKQMILHGNILVNKQKITTKSYSLKNGDLISINKKSQQVIKENLKESQIWPLPPKHLFINFKTMQILFGNFTNLNTSSIFAHKLTLEKIVSGRFVR